MALNFRLRRGIRLLVRHLSLGASKKERLNLPFELSLAAIWVCLCDTSRLEDPRRQEFKEKCDGPWHGQCQKQNRHKEPGWLRQAHPLG